MSDAALISTIEGSELTEDAGAALLLMRDVAGRPHSLAVPIPLAYQLVLALSSALSNAGALTGDPSTKHAFPVQRWDVGPMLGTQNVVLSFELPGGMDLSFIVHRDAARRLHDALSATLADHPRH
jgi:hypothetical protein